MNRSERYFWPAIFVLGAVVGAGVTCIVRLAIGPGLAGPALNVVSAITAGSAFGLSLLTYRYNGRKSKRDLFVSMHEKLVAPDVQHGRKILSEKVKGKESVEHLTGEDFECVNRSLALYETLAMYSIRGDVFKEDVLLTWGLALYNRSSRIRDFTAYRADKDGYRSWPHLTAVLDELELNPPGAGTPMPCD